MKYFTFNKVGLPQVRTFFCGFAYLGCNFALLPARVLCSKTSWTWRGRDPGSTNRLQFNFTNEPILLQHALLVSHKAWISEVASHSKEYLKRKDYDGSGCYSVNFYVPTLATVVQTPETTPNPLSKLPCSLMILLAFNAEDNLHYKCMPK